MGKVNLSKNELLKISNISNPNLLINGDFRVNQRGKTSYTGTCYGIDRWQGSDYLTVTSQTNGGVQLSASGGQGYFVQRIEETDCLWGKTLTMSFSINGEVYTGTNILPSSRPTTGGTFVDTIWINGSVRARLYYYASSKMLAYTFDISNGSTVIIDYAKLEIGKCSTTYSPRPYAEELALCLRYYYKLKGYYKFIGYGICMNTEQVNINIDLPQPMRLIPTANIPKIDIPDAANVKVLCGNNVGRDFTEFSTGNTDSLCSKINFQFIVTGAVSGAFAILYLNKGGTIEFDAEIY